MNIPFFSWQSEPAERKTKSPTPSFDREDAQSLPQCDETCALLQYYRRHLYHSAVRVSLPPKPPSLPDTTLPGGNSIANPTSTGPPEAMLHGLLRPWETRLVRLVGWDPQTGLLQIQLFRVEHADMEGVAIVGTSDVVTYVALSHVWGLATDEGTVLCNGQKTAISSRLLEALSYLVEQTSEKYIWVDQLCINQNDKAEKASQIRNMLRIFEKASKVIAWIGSRATLSPLSVLTFDPCYKCTHSERCLKAWRHLHSSLFRIAHDELWSRTWCRQEIFAARTLVLLGPSFTKTDLCLEDFYGLLEQCIKYDRCVRPSNDKRKEKEISTTLDIMVKHYQHAGTDRVSYAVPAAKTRYTAHWLRQVCDGTAFKVTDERDRVYAVLQMVSSMPYRFLVEDRPDKEAEMFPIDYSKSVSGVYQDLTKYLINRDQNLDCLCVLEDRSARNLPDDLPSWTIDWRNHQPRSILDVPPSRSADQEMHGVPREQDLNDFGRLVLDGQILFEVKELSCHEPTKLDIDMAEQTENFKGRFGEDHPLPTVVFGTADELDNRCSEMSGSYMRCKFYMRLSDFRQGRAFKEVISVPNTTRIGDFLVLLKGARFPFVLRRLHNSSYHLVGPALNGPILGSHKWAVTLTPNGNQRKDWLQRALLRHVKLYWSEKRAETFVTV